MNLGSLVFSAIFPRSNALFRRTVLFQRFDGTVSNTGASLHQTKTYPCSILLLKKSRSSPPLPNEGSNHLVPALKRSFFKSAFPVRVFFHSRTCPVGWDGLSKKCPLNTH